jgi:dienelactone hydrolase
MRTLLAVLCTIILMPTADAETFEARIAALAPHMRVVRPEGAGPFPVVLQFHGCGGVKSLQERYANAAREAGWAAVIVDSHAHRGIGRLSAYSTVCTGTRLWGRERAGDLYAALEWARRQGWANGERLAVAGWSHGGWAILDALSMTRASAERATRLEGLPEEPLTGLDSVFLVYPYCSVGCLAALHGWRVRPRTQAIVGGRDSVVGCATPLRTLRRLKNDGAPIDIAVFPNATHAFDEAEARDFRVRYDPQLTQEAVGLYQRLLQSESMPRKGERIEVEPVMAQSDAGCGR